MIPKYAKHWGSEAKRFWKYVNDDYSITAEYLEILRITVDRLDAYWKAVAVINDKGATYMIGEAVRRRPEVEIARVSYSGFLNGCKLLCIDTKDHSRKQGRPGGV